MSSPQRLSKKKKVRMSELRKNYFGEQRKWEWGIWRKTH